MPISAIRLRSQRIWWKNEYAAKLCGFEVGDELTVEQLFNALLIYSGNDAANALAVHVAGSMRLSQR